MKALEIIEEIKSRKKNHIIALGGGTGYSDLTSSFKGKILYLHSNIECILDIYSRKKLDNSTENLRRKLIFKSDKEIITEFKRRDSLFRKNADIVIDNSWMLEEESSKLVIKTLNENKIIVN